MIREGRLVAGPLTKTSTPSAEPGPMEWDVPSKFCTECGELLTVVRAHFYGGVHCGCTWTLRCPVDEQTYEWHDYDCYGDEEYGCGDPACPAEQERGR